ncbi:hypothetical protein ACFE04_020802 [Oxalis oulophora]
MILAWSANIRVDEEGNYFVPFFVIPPVHRQLDLGHARVARKFETFMEKKLEGIQDYDSWVLILFGEVMSVSHSPYPKGNNEKTFRSCAKPLNKSIRLVIVETSVSLGPRDKTSHERFTKAAQDDSLEA